MDKNLFAIATKNKYRWPSAKGQLSVEDLWDLSVEKLDEIYRELNMKLNQAQQASLLKDVSKEDAILADKVAVVMQIVAIKLDAAKKNADAKERASKKARLMNIYEQKQDAALAQLPAEQLLKLINEL